MWNHHESNQRKIGQLVEKFEQVHRDDQSLLPLLVHSFIACGRTRRPHAPACVKWEGWTHTHTRTLLLGGGERAKTKKRKNSSFIVTSSKARSP